MRSGEVSLAVAEAGDASAPPVVLIHGYPDTKEVWEPVMERLAADFHVVAYDVRGAGASTAPRGRAAYDIERLADDFEAVCDAVTGAQRPPVHLVGHDWGGIQGWEFVTSGRFAGRIASFTSIAGPALGHAVRATRATGGQAQARQLLRAMGRMRRSWYIGPLCLPGGPSLAWRGLLAGDRWRRYLETEGVPVDDRYPTSTVCADGLHGANLYRQNIPRRLLAAVQLPSAHAPVQLIIPTGDRFISESYYAAAEEVAPGLRRRTVPGSHWAPRTQPALVSQLISEWAHAAMG